MSFANGRGLGVEAAAERQRVSLLYGRLLILVLLVLSSASKATGPGAEWHWGNSSNPAFWGPDPVSSYINAETHEGVNMNCIESYELIGCPYEDQCNVRRTVKSVCGGGVRTGTSFFKGCEHGTYDPVTYQCEPPPVDCASQGRKMKQYFPDGPAPPSTFFDANGCEYGAPAGASEYGTHYECGYDLANSFYCNMFYEPTGNNGTPTAFEPNDEPIDDGEQPPLDGDYYEDPPPETTTQSEPPLIEPDTPAPGDTSTTTTTTKTETDPGASDVTSTSTEVTFEQEGDTIKTTTTTTTTTTHADGTTTTTTQTDVTTTKADSTKITFDGTEYTNTSTPGYSTTGSQTTTTSTGADGSSTTTSSGGTGDLDGNGQDDDEEQGEWKPGEAGQFADTGDELAAARQQLQDAIGQVQAEASALFSNQLPVGGGSLPCYSFNAIGQSYNVCLSDYEQQLSVIGTAVLFVFVATGLIIIVR